MKDHLKDKKTKLPDQKQLENELSKFIAEKYGQKAKVVAPKLCPTPDLDMEDDDDGVWSRINFDMHPEDLVAYLDQYIVRQDEAKAVLATKVCTHFNRARYLCRQGDADPADGVGLIKNNVLMIGPTGVGKTYMVKLIAAKLGVPFVKGDATKFSETGYVGGDVEDLIRDLVQEADDDLEMAQFGIVYIDEIDKIASTANLIGPDVSRTGVQRALLKPMEETEVDLKVPHDPISQIQAIERYRKTGQREKRSLNTRHILFIMSGAFNELAEVTKKRLNTTSLGFGGALPEPTDIQDYLKQVVPQDLVDFGFETEFVGRLPVTVVLEHLEANDLYQILKNPNNPVVISKKRDFAAYEIDLRFEDSALETLAQEASEMKTGARALVSVLEKALLPFEKRLPSTEVKRLVVTPELVADPQGTLEKILDHPEEPSLEKRFQEAVREERVSLLRMIARREPLYSEQMDRPITPARMDLIADEYYRVGMTLGSAFARVLERLADVRDFEDNFYERFNLGINFDEAAEAAILTEASNQGVSVLSYCNRLAQMLEPGLRLVRDRLGQTDFDLPEEAIIDTEGYLADLFQQHYQTALVHPAQEE